MPQPIRPAAAAGMFYPGSSAELARLVDRLVSDASRKRAGVARMPKAIIATHA